MARKSRNVAIAEDEAEIFIPPAGHSRIATHGLHEFYILPSTHDGYFFLAHVQLDSNKVDSGAIVSGLRRPIKWEGVAAAVSHMVPRIDWRKATWQTAPCGPSEHNIFLAGQTDIMPRTKQQWRK